MSSIFLKVDNISGESKDANHVGWIDVKSMNWGTSRNTNGSGTVHYKNLSVHTSVDKATPAMFLYASNGRKISKIEISSWKSGGIATESYRITLENVLIVDIFLHDAFIDSEVTYEFQADKVKIQYWEQTALGGKGAETRSGWDIKNNTSSF